VKKLSQFSLFKGLTHDVLAEISLFSHTRTYEEGETLISENQSGDYNLYLLVYGEVEITSNKTLITSGEAVLSREQKEVLGEISWLLNVRRTATVKALRETEAIEINGTKLDNYLKQHPETGYVVMSRIAKLIASRLQESDTLLKQILWNSNI
jgi:NTE family protein